MKQIFIYLVLLALIGNAYGGLYTFDSDIVITDLSKENFAQRVFSTPELWLVQFYKAHTCEPCKKFVKEYTAIADNIGGLVNVAAIDCEEQVELCSVFKLDHMPMVMLFPSQPEPIPDRPNQYIKNPKVYQGPGTAGGISHWVIKNLPDEVTIIDEKNIDSYLSTDLPKVLLFSEKPKPANLFKSLSLTYKNALSFGMVRSTDTVLVQKYNIDKFPAIIAITNEGISRYDGPNKKPQLSQFLLPFATAYWRSKNPNPPPQETTETPREEPNVPELHHVTNQDEFEKSCRPQGLCFIVFLDPADEGHLNYINFLESMVTRHPSFTIMWVEGPSNLPFQKGFNLPDGYPQAVLLQRKKLKYRIFTGAFDEELIDEFFQMATSGKGRTATLSKLPSFNMKEDL